MTGVRQLRDGDVLRLGDVELRFSAPEGAGTPWAARLVTTPAGRMLHRIGSSARKTVLGAGAIAAAIVAILSLWPSGPEELSGAVAARVVTEEMPLSQYVARTTGSLLMDDVAASGGGVVADAVAVVPAAMGRPGAGATTGDNGTTGGPDPADSPDSVDDPGSTESPEPAESPDPTEAPQPFSSSAVDDVLDETLDCTTPGCRTGMEPVVRSIAASIDRVELVSTEVVAERFVEFLDELRTEPAASGEDPDPVGVVVSADVELSGFPGESRPPAASTCGCPSRATLAPTACVSSSSPRGPTPRLPAERQLRSARPVLQAST